MPPQEYNSFSSFTNLANYTSTGNMYTFPCDGYVTVNDVNSGGGTVRIYFAGTNSYMTVGMSGERQALYAKKGLQAYLNGTVTSARFYPLDRRI